MFMFILDFIRVFLYFLWFFCIKDNSSIRMLGVSMVGVFIVRSWFVKIYLGKSFLVVIRNKERNGSMIFLVLILEIIFFNWNFIYIEWKRKKLLVSFI